MRYIDYKTREKGAGQKKHTFVSQKAQQIAFLSLQTVELKRCQDYFQILVGYTTLNAIAPLHLKPLQVKKSWPVINSR